MTVKEGFGKGFNKTRKFKKKSPVKLKSLKTRKTKNKKMSASEQEKMSLLESLAKMKGLPPDVEKNIGKHARKKIDPKVEKDLILYARLRKTQDKYYSPGEKKKSTKTFYAIAAQYRKGYVMALENDIDEPHHDLFEWLQKNWKNIVGYIGNRKKIDSWPGIRHFVDTTYSEKVPKQVKFRDIVNDVNSYLWEFEYS